MTRKKVAILGGGVGAMTAAWALTSEPGAAEKYEIHVYQMGWRLGGKGASGRNPAHGQRIEEHGLHIWSGFYENAFRVMRECFAELQGEPNVYHSVDEAFSKDNNIVLEEKTPGGWKHWPLRPAMKDSEPGVGDSDLTPMSYFRALVGALKDLLDDRDPRHKAGQSDLDDDDHDDPLTQLLKEKLGETMANVLTAPLHQLQHLLSLLPQPFQGGHQVDDALLGHVVGRVQKDLRKRRAAARKQNRADDDLRRMHELLDLGSAALRGIVLDGVLRHGFDAIDHYEIWAWLKRHGAEEESANSAMLLAVYDYVFGYRHGKTEMEDRSIGAGTFLRGSLRLALTYKGAIFYRMSAGMGDTIFSPLYKALKKRGVTFHFFQKVTGLHLNKAGSAVDSISMQRQVTTKGDYNPFVRVKGLDCWPSDPLWDQIVEADELKARHVNLESAWTDWDPPGSAYKLRLGRDYDEIVLGIALGALPYIAQELIEAAPSWRRMVDKVGTTATQAVQLWLGSPSDHLGWKSGRSIVTAYADDLNTWADMSHLLPTEDWGRNEEPESVAYFCGPFPDPGVMPPFTDTDYPRRAREQVVAGAREWMQEHIAQLLPGMRKHTGKFDYARLIAYAGLNDDSKWQAQFFRANVEPTERYVLSSPGTASARLRADKSGFDHLWLAGDWTYTGINAGCVEAAAMSGLRAAAGLAGITPKIIGEDEDPTPPVMEAIMPEAEAPILKTFRPQNAPWPWSAVYGMAETTGPTVILPVPVEDVQKMLPRGLALAPQNITPKGMHPVILLFAQQRDVRMNIMPFGLTSYMEFICAVPFVVHDSPALKDMAPMIWPQRLYLDSGPAIALGVHGFGFPKQRAEITADEESYIVRDPATDTEIISCSFLRDGPKTRAFNLPHFAKIRPGYEMAMVTKGRLGGWQYSVYDFSLDSARLEPVEMTIRIGQNNFGLPAGVHHVPSLRTSPLGGFYLTADGTINNPLQSTEIRKILAGEKKR